MLPVSDVPSAVDLPREELMVSRSSIAESAERRLRESPYQFLKRVSCDFHEGVLTLRGRVPSFFLKQLAQAAVVGLEGVEEVVNRVEVVELPTRLRAACSR